MSLIIVLAALGWPQAVPWRAVGWAEAERDIAAGTMKLKVYGFRAGFREIDRVARVYLRDRLGLELEAVNQCIMARELADRARGYNDRIQQEVEARHGAGAIDEVVRAAWRDTDPERVAYDWTLKVVVGGILIGLVAYRRVVFSAPTTSSADLQGPR